MQETVGHEEVVQGQAAWDRVRLVLLTVWLLLVVVSLAVGHRETPLSALEAAVAEGRVERVVVLGQAAPAGQGFTTQVVHWRDGIVRRTTQATVGVAADAGPGAGTAASRAEDLGVLLSRADPDLEVRRSSQAHFSPGGSWLGWQVPGWVAMSGFLVLLLQLGFLVGVPRTWRATRWAWFWVMTVPVVGSVLLLLLAGRTPGLPAPTARARRLTGGWAFLLCSAARPLVEGLTTGGGV